MSSTWNDESGLSHWRDISPSERLRERVVKRAIERKPRLTRVIPIGAIALALVITGTVLLGGNSAQAAYQRMHQSLMKVTSVHIVTWLADSDHRKGGWGESWIVEGAFRRDGLRGIRGLRTADGKWGWAAGEGIAHYPADTRKISAQAFTVENLSLAWGTIVDQEFDPAGAVNDQGYRLDVLHLTKRWDGRETKCTFYIDPKTGLPQHCRFEDMAFPDQKLWLFFDEELPPELFEPKNLAKGPDELFTHPKHVLWEPRS